MSGSSLHDCLHRFPGAVLELSAEGVVLASNGRLEEVLGREVSGRLLAEALDETSQPKWSRILSPEEGREPDWPWELVFQTAGSLELRAFLVVRSGTGDDRRVWLLEHEPHRKAERLFDEISDLNSELVHAQRELARERRRLADALRDATAAVAARDEVLAFVSHDLRNPLQTVLMSAELLELPLPEERKAVQIQVIRRAATGMSRLIEDLLTVSEAEADRERVAPEPLLLDELFERVCGQFENLTRQKQQRLEWSVAPDVPTVAGDRHRLARVLSNLLGNAIKFTPERGSGPRPRDRQGNRGGARRKDMGGERGGGGYHLLLHPPRSRRVEARTASPRSARPRHATSAPRPWSCSAAVPEDVSAFSQTGGFRCPE